MVVQLACSQQRTAELSHRQSAGLLALRAALTGTLSFRASRDGAMWVNTDLHDADG